ncbi:MAG: ABC transporter ATP-binding protein [Fuerstiella sp.]|nr:ABC transporter ATP-binding protein [Fuerstiella sp.]MCP4855697.1 ABC transporter ATP-binding protein [Fuerstiella sp.]
MAESVIEVRDLRKTYRSGLLKRRSVNALEGVSLEVPRGQIYGLLGPNGAGKTTLIKVLLGIVRKTSGAAHVLGHTAGQIAARRRVGYLPENHRIPRHLTGSTALEYYGCLSGLSVAEVRRRIPELLDRVGLLGRERDRVSGYSKGMQQRLGLAQAMLHKPDLIILDEPTDGVDPVGRKQIREVLRSLADDGASIFLNSHLLQEIELICDRVAILSKGSVRRTGSVEELTAAIAESPTVFRIATDRTTAEGCFDLSTVSKVEDVTEGVLDIHASLPQQPQVDRIVDALRSNGVSLLSMKRRDLTLEEAFLQIVRESER